MSRKVKPGVIYSHRMRDIWIKEAREQGARITPLGETQRANCAIEQHVKMSECCVMCGIRISVMTFRGSGVCSELCRKDRDHDHGRSRAISP